MTVCVISNDVHTLSCIVIWTRRHIRYTSQETYEIRGFAASVIRSFSAASSRISAESSKGVRRIIEGCLRNR